MANATIAPEGGGGGGRGPNATMQQQQKLNYAKWDLCDKEGAVAVLEASPSSRLEDGTILVSAATVPYPPAVPFNKRISSRAANATKILPKISIANEPDNRLVRLLQKENP